MTPLSYADGVTPLPGLGVRLVLGISRLGDADLAGWWSTHGLDDVGEYVLSDLFPRTWKVTAVQMSLTSALKRHRDFLPDRSNIVHLFSDRLRFALQAQELLAELKTGGDEGLLDHLQGWTSRELAEAELHEWVGPSPQGERLGQVTRLGVLSADALDDEEQALSAARLLASAFLGQDSELVIPYFDVTS